MLVIVLTPFGFSFYCRPPFLVGLYQQMFVEVNVCHFPCPFRFGFVFLSVFTIAQILLKSKKCHTEIVILTKERKSGKFVIENNRRQYRDKH